MSLATISNLQGGSLQLVIVRYGFGLNSEIQSAQLQQGIVHYPIKVLQNDFKFTVQFRSVADYGKMQTFIHTADKYAVSPAALGQGAINGALRFYYPEMGLDYLGFVRVSPMGGKKFDFAPKIDYTMVLIKDSIYSPTQNATQVPGFGNIVGGDTVDVNSATGDPALIPPAAPLGPAPGPGGG